MIFNGAFSPAGDHNDVPDASQGSLFGDVLNKRLVDQRQHFFRRGFGGG